MPPPRAVEVMHEPGAAMVCARPVAVAAKFEKGARTSSPLQPRGPTAPGSPSVSDIAVTASTSG